MSERGDGLDTPLSCDVRCGHMVFRKGVSLRTLTDAAARWLKDAQDAMPPVNPEKLAELRRALTAPPGADTSPAEPGARHTTDAVEKLSLLLFAVGRSDAHGPDIYEEQAGYWRDLAGAILGAGYRIFPAEPAVTDAMERAREVVDSMTVDFGSDTTRWPGRWRSRITAAITSAVEQERQACATIAHELLRTDAIKLCAGEMTAQEVRSVKAIVGAIHRAIRSRSPEPPA